MNDRDALDELRRLSKKACRDPLFATDSEHDGRLGALHNGERAWTISRVADESGWTTDMGYPGYGMSEGNAKFAAACWNYVRAMIAASPTNQEKVNGND